MLRRTLIRGFDQFREAQRPVEAAFTIQDPQRRLDALKTVVKQCVTKPHAKGSADLRRHPKEANAYVLATLSFCRSRGAWREALEVAGLAHKQHALPLKKEWIPLCLEGAKTLDDRHHVLDGLGKLYGALPAELYSRSSADIPKLLFSKHETVKGGSQGISGGRGTAGGALPSGGRGDNSSIHELAGYGPVSGSSLALSSESSNYTSLGDMLTAAISTPSAAVALAPISAVVPVSGNKSTALARNIAEAAYHLQTSPQAMASLPTVNPSFITYITSQNIVRTPAEADMMVSALTGRPMAGLVGGFGAASQAKAMQLASTGRADVDPFVQQTLFMKRPIVVRINRSTPLWKGVRELLRRQAPFLVPLPWYPDELAWVVINRDISEVAAETSAVAGKGSTMDVNQLRKLRVAQMNRLRHLLQTLVDEGLLSFQSAASMLPAVALCGHLAKENAEANTSRGNGSSYRVLDLCAAPGGKTQQVIDLLAAQQDSVSSSSPNGYRRTLVVANDADERRLKAMRGRLGGKDASVAFTHFSADAFPLPAAKVLAHHQNHNSRNQRRDDRYLSESASSSASLFDGVLLDAPCTGEGRMHRDAQGWRSWHPRNCLGFHRMQLRALRRAIAATRDGGVVIYSTCTMNPIENEAVVAAVVVEGLADVVPISGRSRRDHGKNNGAEATFDGFIPEQLLPFVSRGLTNWGVPMPNGEYTRPVTHDRNGGEGNDTKRYDFGEMGSAERTRERPRLPQGVDETMLPPRSAALARMVANACCRITPFPRHESVGQPPSAQDPSKGRHLTQMEAFFMCKLVVKISPQKRAAIAAESYSEAESEGRDSRHNYRHREERINSGGGLSNSSNSGGEGVYSFKNASKFTFVDSNDFMLAKGDSQRPTSSTTAAFGAADPHAAARKALARLARDYGIDPLAIVGAAEEATHTPGVKLAIRPILETSSAHSFSSTPASVYDLYAMSPALADFLNSSWLSPSSTAESFGDHHSSHSHRQTRKQTTLPSQQQLLSPGTCLFHAVVLKGGGNHGSSGHGALVMPTEAGAATIAAAVVSSGGDKQERVLDVPVEFLQHLMAMRQPIPSAILNPEKGQIKSSASDRGAHMMNNISPSDALLLLSALVSRFSASGSAASLSGSLEVSLTTDQPLPFPSMVLTGTTLTDPRYAMVRRMQNAEGVLGRSQHAAMGMSSGGKGEANWVTSLLGSSLESDDGNKNNNTLPLAGPLVLNVRIQTNHRRSGKSSGYAGRGTNEEMVISLPAIAIPEARASPHHAKAPQEQGRSKLDLSKLQSLSAPASNRSSNKNNNAAADTRRTFLALTCNQSTLSQLTVLLQRVLGSAVTLDNASMKSMLLEDDRLTGRGSALLESGVSARFTHLAGGGNEAWDHGVERGNRLFDDRREGEMLLADSSTKPLFDAPAPLAVKASLKHLAALEDSKKNATTSNGSQKKIAAPASPLHEVSF